MSAPKEGLDYFPFSVDLLDDESLDFLREQYGVVVNDIYISLLCLLYKRKGYYIPYETKKEKTDCVWFIYKRVRGGKYPVQQEAIPRVIEAIVAQGLFDRDHFNKIITSERAQRTYYSATVERKLESFNINPEYWLLDDAVMRKLSKKHPYYLFLHPPIETDETESKSDETESKSGDLSLNKIKRDITSNEVIKVSKKVSNKKEEIESYDEIFEGCGVNGTYKSAFIEFIRYLKASYGIVVLNDRLYGMIAALDMKYRDNNNGKITEINRAIVCGYKRLECEGD